MQKQSKHPEVPCKAALPLLAASSSRITNKDPQLVFMGTCLCKLQAFPGPRPQFGWDAPLKGNARNGRLVKPPATRMAERWSLTARPQFNIPVFMSGMCGVLYVTNAHIQHMYISNIYIYIYVYILLSIQSQEKLRTWQCIYGSCMIMLPHVAPHVAQHNCTSGNWQWEQ